MSDSPPVAKVSDTLRRLGPLTGAELLDATGLEVFALWKTCLDQEQLEWSVVGRRYLRLDRTVEGYARLSPSIKREFLTYTLVACLDQRAERERRAAELADEFRRISREKRLLARVRLRGVLEELPESEHYSDDVCFVIAGDIVYDMAHAVDRPEPSTGKMVRGSDLDVVVVVRNSVPDSYVAALERAILREKFLLLTHPTYREEIDFIIKPVSRVEEQLRFDTFEHMVASKILHEGRYLFGSRKLLHEVKRLTRAAGVPSKLAGLERRARAYRLESEIQLKGLKRGPTRDALYRYFYTKEEAPEIY